MLANEEMSPAVRRVMLLAAVAAFVAGIALSIRSQPDLLRHIRWSPLLALAFFAIPSTLLLNAVEFMLSARLVGQSSSFARALEITVIGSAANLLPVPGAAMVRIAALKRGGASLARSFSMTALLAVLWLGVATAYAALWALYALGGPVAGLLLLAGLLVVVVSSVVSVRYFGQPSIIAGLTVARLGLVIVDAARIYLGFAALGVAASFAQCSILTIAGVLASVVAIVPAGLGLREGIAALMAPLVGLRSGPAFLATSLSRIVGMAVVMALTVGLTLRRKVPDAT